MLPNETRSLSPRQPQYTHDGDVVLRSGTRELATLATRLSEAESKMANNTATATRFQFQSRDKDNESREFVPATPPISAHKRPHAHKHPWQAKPHSRSVTNSPMHGYVQKNNVGAAVGASINLISPNSNPLPNHQMGMSHDIVLGTSLSPSITPGCSPREKMSRTPLRTHLVTPQMQAGNISNPTAAGVAASNNAFAAASTSSLQSFSGTYTYTVDSCSRCLDLEAQIKSAQQLILAGKQQIDTANVEVKALKEDVSTLHGFVQTFNDRNPHLSIRLDECAVNQKPRRQDVLIRNVVVSMQPTIYNVYLIAKYHPKEYWDRFLPPMRKGLRWLVRGTALLQFMAYLVLLLIIYVNGNNRSDSADASMAKHKQWWPPVTFFDILMLPLIAVGIIYTYHCNSQSWFDVYILGNSVQHRGERFRNSLSLYKYWLEIRFTSLGGVLFFVILLLFSHWTTVEGYLNTVMNVILYIAILNLNRWAYSIAEYHLVYSAHWEPKFFKHSFPVDFSKEARYANPHFHRVVAKIAVIVGFAFGFCLIPLITLIIAGLTVLVKICLMLKE